MSRQQWYPNADLSRRYDGSYSGDRQDVNTVVWHSTEGTALPTYGVGASAPTLTAVPDFKAKKLKWYQHFPFDMSARALRNASGGVDTNTLNVAQVEIVGTCDPATHAKWKEAGRAHLYMPELPGWVVRDLALFAAWAHDEHGVPLSSGLTFKAYPDSYGSNGVRMTGAKWSSFSGHCGHMHVPENDHGDPGVFPMKDILSQAQPSSEIPEPPRTAPKPPAPTLPKVSLSNVRDAARRDPQAAQGATSHPADVRPVEAALKALGYLPQRYAADGSFGTKTVAAYRKVQQRLGYSGPDADGIPGALSLTWLGRRTNLFTVKD